MNEDIAISETLAEDTQTYVRRCVDFRIDRHLFLIWDVKVWVRESSALFFKDQPQAD